MCSLGSEGGLVTRVPRRSLAPTAELEKKRKILYSAVYTVLMLAAEMSKVLMLHLLELCKKKIEKKTPTSF